VEKSDTKIIDLKDFVVKHKKIPRIQTNSPHFSQPKVMEDYLLGTNVILLK